jgi:hypothetical protein
MFVRLAAFAFNKSGQPLAMLGRRGMLLRNQGAAMQLFLVIELALMLVLMVTVGIRNIEQELRRKPIRYYDTD